MNGASWGEDDVNIMLGWLDNTGINFGRCAFETVTRYLTDNGITVSLEDAARDLILIDIFAGTIDCFTEGALEISLYAMNKYIDKQLDASGANSYYARLDYDDLAMLLDDGEEVIVHMDGNHYVIVTGFDADGNIEYYEPIKGVSGEVVTIDVLTFRMHWTGYAISDRAPPAGKEVSALEALSVRGNFDPILIIVLFTFSLASAALSFIDNEICQTISKILGVASLVLSVFMVAVNLPGIIENFFKNMVDIGTGFSKAMSGGFSILASGIKGLAVNLPAIAKLALNTISAISLNIALTQGMSFLNINSDIARITASFLTGGFMSLDGYFLSGALVASTRTSIGIIGRDASKEEIEAIFQRINANGTC